MESSKQHLCELLQPCCLEKISKSVLIEIVAFVINVLFFSLILEFISMIVYSILLYFYPPIKSEECSTKEFKQGYENNKPVKVSKTSELFAKSLETPVYNFNF
jgi:hypothetical protein